MAHQKNKIKRINLSPKQWIDEARNISHLASEATREAYQTTRDFLSEVVELEGDWVVVRNSDGHTTETIKELRRKTFPIGSRFKI